MKFKEVLGEKFYIHKNFSTPTPKSNSSKTTHKLDVHSGIAIGVAGATALSLIINKIKKLHEKHERAKDEATKERIMKEIEAAKEHEKRLKEM